MEATYKTKDVTNKTGIPKHIVRKYSQLLEEHGYIISKTADARIYKLDDLKLLKSIHERAATLQEDISETIPIILKEKRGPTLHQLYKICKKYNRKKKKMGVTSRSSC